jgi:hypothetical protein
VTRQQSRTDHTRLADTPVDGTVPSESSEPDPDMSGESVSKMTEDGLLAVEVANSPEQTVQPASVDDVTSQEPPGDGYATVTVENTGELTVALGDDPDLARWTGQQWEDIPGPCVGLRPALHIEPGEKQEFHIPILTTGQDVDPSTRCEHAALSALQPGWYRVTWVFRAIDGDDTVGLHAHVQVVSGP